MFWQYRPHLLAPLPFKDWREQWNNIHKAFFLTMPLAVRGFLMLTVFSHWCPLIYPFKAGKQHDSSYFVQYYNSRRDRSERRGRRSRKRKERRKKSEWKWFSQCPKGSWLNYANFSSPKGGFSTLTCPFKTRQWSATMDTLQSSHCQPRRRVSGLVCASIPREVSLNHPDCSGHYPMS